MYNPRRDAGDEHAAWEMLMPLWIPWFLFQRHLWGMAFLATSQFTQMQRKKVLYGNDGKTNMAEPSYKQFSTRE